MITVTCEDNMAMMARYEDNHFDLAIVDPPYGIGANKMTLGNGKNKIYRGESDWDNETPPKEYWDELYRVSKNQIVWGANYMTSYLKPSMGWIYWDKCTGGNDFSDGELAYTSFNRALRCFKQSWVGANANNGTPRIHPTEKPIKMYEWILRNYAKEGDKIIDTHYGSGSIGLACHNGGFDLTACEIDAKYYADSMKRLERHQAQGSLF